MESRHLGELVKSDGLLRRGGGLDVADKFKLTGSRQLYYHTVGKEAVDGRGGDQNNPILQGRVQRLAVCEIC